jgi:acetate kinase
LSIQSVLHAKPDLGGAVIAHLGSGCSVTAVADGLPRHTSMSFTPTSGTVSTTRSGDLDPEIVLFLIEEHGFSVERLRGLLDRSSGVAGIAGGRRDLRDLLASDDADAALAFDVFVTDIAMTIAACATTLDDWDSLVFTGGIGENSDIVRDRILDRLITLRAGPSGDPDRARAFAATGVRVLVVPADEEGVLDRLSRAFVSAGSAA